MSEFAAIYNSLNRMVSSEHQYTEYTDIPSWNATVYPPVGTPHFFNPSVDYAKVINKNPYSSMLIKIPVKTSTFTAGAGTTTTNVNGLSVYNGDIIVNRTRGFARLCTRVDATNCTVTAVTGQTVGDTIDYYTCLLLPHIEVPAGATLPIKAKNIEVIVMYSKTAQCDCVVMGGWELDYPAIPKRSKLNYSYFDAYGSVGRVVGCRQNIVYSRTTSGILQRSTNGGITNTTVLDVTASSLSVRNVHITSTGEAIAFLSSSSDPYASNQIWRAADGITFTKVDTTALDPLKGILWHGVDSNIDTVMIVEYSIVDGDHRVLRSIDGGATWAAVLTQTAQADIRHFHSINYNPYNATWIVTAGDTDAQCKWWKSVDDGATLAAVEGITNQKWRTLNVTAKNYDEIIWGSDVVQKGGAQIFKATMSAIATPTIIGELPHTVWGHYQQGARIIVFTATEIGDPDLMAQIWLSEDSGTTWTKDFEWKTSTQQGGFKGFFGPTDKGNIFIPTFYVTGAYSSEVCIRVSGI